MTRKEDTQDKTFQELENKRLPRSKEFLLRKDDAAFRKQFWSKYATELLQQTYQLFILFYDNAPASWVLVDIPLLGFGYLERVYEFEIDDFLDAFQQQGYASTYYESADQIEAMYVLHHTMSKQEQSVDKQDPTVSGRNMTYHNVINNTLGVGYGLGQGTKRVPVPVLGKKAKTAGKQTGLKKKSV